MSTATKAHPSFIQAPHLPGNITHRRGFLSLSILFNASLKITYTSFMEVHPFKPRPPKAVCRGTEFLLGFPYLSSNTAPHPYEQHAKLCASVMQH